MNLIPKPHAPPHRHSTPRGMAALEGAAATVWPAQVFALDFVASVAFLTAGFFWVSKCG